MNCNTLFAITLVKALADQHNGSFDKKGTKGAVTGLAEARFNK